MTAAVGRAWGWVRSWASSPMPHTTTVVMAEAKGPTDSGGAAGWASWVFGGWNRPRVQSGPVEEFWEAQEKIQPVEIEDVGAGKQETEVIAEQPPPRWWSRYLLWPRKPQPHGPGRRKREGRGGSSRDVELDGEISDYGTPPPSPPPPPQMSSPFRLFVHNWNIDVLPEHYDICFNFLRHLFDLFVVAFLWTVSPPTKLVLEVLGVQGSLRLWFHGMAMFFVSTVGMAGLLWLIQEYLPQFALIYGIVQALVISVSMRQSVLLGDPEENLDEETDVKDTEENKMKSS